MKKPYKIYGDADEIEKTAFEQFAEAMEQDFVIRGALMPDVHTGYSLPIGAVVATDNYVVPSWVGYDIGCGMCALPTSLDPNEIQDKALGIFNGIYKAIPTGFSVNAKTQYTQLNPDHLTLAARQVFDQRKGFLHLGTLGGGNHFIEIGKDENDRVWIIIHSGSRGIGHGIASLYIRTADPEGKLKEGHHGFPARSVTGQAYINDVNWCLRFALENRREMMNRVITVLNAVQIKSGEVNWDGLINRNHNHVEQSKGMWIHRKGATHAEDGMMGVIPGNMRDGSFIVRGKGCPAALWSSSHGAGRVMGRKEAKRVLDTKRFQETMGNIMCKADSSTLDEAPMAYKNIHRVMYLQQELVEIVHHVTPIINVKA